VLNESAISRIVAWTASGDAFVVHSKDQPSLLGCGCGDGKHDGAHGKWQVKCIMKKWSASTELFRCGKRAKKKRNF
jgi:hypothetical protein